jgi:hypothetical protein
LAPSKASRFQAAFLEMLSGLARAWIISTELFHELLFAMHDPDAALDLRFRREAFPALARNLESSPVRCIWFS